MNTFLAVASAALFVFVFQDAETASVHFQSILRSNRTLNSDEFTSDVIESFNTKCLEYDTTRMIGGKISCVLTLPRGDYFIEPGVGAFKIHDTTATWYEARKICSAEGGQLAVLDTKEKRDLFKQWIEERNYGAVWLGFHALIEQGIWLTITGESIYSIGYYPWGSGEPSGSQGGEPTQCAAFWNNGIGDFNCDLARPFICEINVCEALGHRVRDC